MKKSFHLLIARSLIALLLGGVCFYVFLCFNGVVVAASINSGFEAFVLKTFVAPIGASSTKITVFTTYHLLENATVSFVILLAFSFFALGNVHKNLYLSSLIISVGAGIIDLVYFLNLPFDSSYFLDEGTTPIFSSFVSWYFCAVLALKLGSALRNRLQAKGSCPTI